MVQQATSPVLNGKCVGTLSLFLHPVSHTNLSLLPSFSPSLSPSLSPSPSLSLSSFLRSPSLPPSLSLIKAQLPDMEFIVQVSDWPQDKNDPKKEPFPFFSWCGSEYYRDIVWPQYDLMRHTVQAMDRYSMIMNFIKSGFYRYTRITCTC